MAPADGVVDGAAVYAAGVTGDLRSSERWLAAPRASSSEGWRAAIEAQRWLADPSLGELPHVESLAALPADSGRDYAALELGRAAVLACDTAALERCADLLPSGSILHAWAAVAKGCPEDAADFAARAQKSEFAPLRIEAACVRAIACIEAGALGEARAIARRAARMARTEDIPQSQYLSSLVLARVRRLEGAPHLALRITDALRAVVSSPWRGRLAWEQALSGRPPALEVPEAGGWASLFAAAAAGDAARFDRAREQLEACAGAWKNRSRDLIVALGVLDPRLDVATLPTGVRAFVAGAEASFPPGVAGVCTSSEGSAEVGVCVHPDGRARRVAALAEPFARAVFGVRHDPLKPGRTSLAIAVLAFAGPEGLTREALFRRTYGFAFDVALHEGLFRTLLHRMRRAVEAYGSIEALEGRIALRAQEPLFVMDPRCESSLEERMLRLLARAHHRGAKDVAKALGVPLRTAQTALKALSESGAVAGRRVGRRIEYRVEDTTFSEPTRWR